MRMTDRWLNILVGGALLALLPLAWLQYHWIGDVSEAEHDRLAGELRTALERIAADSDRDAGRLHMTIVGPGIGPLATRIQGYRPDEQSIPLQAIYRLRQGESGWEAEEWSEAQAKMVPVAVPGWWEAEPFHNGPVMNDPPGVLGPERNGEDGPPSFVVLLFDPKRVVDSYVPKLLQRHLGQNYEEDYAVRVAKAKELTGQKIVASIFRRIDRQESPPGPRPPPPGGRKMRRKKGADQWPQGPGIWRAEVRHLDGPLETLVERTRLRNLAVSGVTLLFLGLALASVGHALRRARRLTRLQLEFTAGVSHELRTPLAVIVSAADNLAGGYVKDPVKVREYGALVREEGTRLTAMVDQVLRFAEFESEWMPLEKRAILASDVVNHVEREMRPAAEHHGGAWESGAANAALAADENALRVALRNLVENALRHGGGKWIRVEVQKVGHFVEFIVEDRGPGLAASDLPYLFDPFYRGADSRTRKKKGSGLGLALVDRIARGHGGQVYAENRPGGGARFRMAIPNE